jgi:hypothetical protein
MKKIFFEAQWYIDAEAWSTGLDARMPNIPTDSALSKLAVEFAEKGYYSRTAHPEDYIIDDHALGSGGFITRGYYFGDETKLSQAQDYLAQREAIQAGIPCVPGSARLVICEENTHPTDSCVAPFELAVAYL